MKKPKKQQSQQSGSSDSAKPVETSATVSSARSDEASPAARVVIKEVGGEPTMKRASVPVLLIALLVALVYWGNMFIVQHGGELDARVHHPYTSFKQVVDYQPKDETQAMLAKGALVYKNVCAACHQNDGNGSASQNAPPLAGSEWVLAKDPTRIIHIVLNGLGGPITVKGKEWGAVQMPPWKAVLSDEDVAMVLTFVRNTWGNKAPSVAPSQVQPIREQTKDAGPETAAGLMQISLKE